jgi:guanyl-specific ribonuclease Sa
MLKNYSQLITGIVIGLLAGLLLAKLLFVNNRTAVPVTTNTQTQQNNRENKNSNTNPAKEYPVAANQNIPAKVYVVLKFIKENNHAMNHYVGGRVFTNREKVLPETSGNGDPIRYQEWDVNPKIEGQNRGTERICTGSDGRSWYTNNHYQSFTEIK